MPYILLARLFIGVGSAQDFERRLDERRCVTPTTKQRNLLPADWKPFQRFVRACPIKDQKGTTRLVLLTISATAYYNSIPGKTATQVPLPHARLYLPDGKPCGELPYAFPDDPPVELHAVFRHWRDGFPQRIDMDVKDEAVGGDRRLPSLQWNNLEHIFKSIEEK